MRKLGCGTRAKTLEQRKMIFEKKQCDGKILGTGHIRKKYDKEGCC